ncbi:MAG: glycosyltransferase family 2 protein [Deltaproteobacteria bacterium]|nr:glycosyltransferase family 2 protein [Deltaproteobacteria bacterium]
MATRRKPAAAPPAAAPASDVTIVVPAFNEERGIGPVIEALARLAGRPRILVIDDGSSDATGAVARAAGARVIRHARNRGYGAAVKTGVRNARTRYVLLCDADGQHRAEDVAKLVAARRPEAMVVGERGHGAYQVASRKPGKWLLTKVAESIAGERIPDLNSGLRIFDRALVSRFLYLLPDGFSASTTVTLLFYRRGFDISYVPIQTVVRVGTSTVKPLRDGLATLYLILKLVIVFHPLRFFVPPGIALVAIGFTQGTYRALVSGRGFTVAGLLVAVTGLLTLFFGILADQISTLAANLAERDLPPLPDDDGDEGAGGAVA